MALASQILRRGLSTSAMTSQKVLIVGAGLMGTGIAQVSAQSGHNVSLVDNDGEALTQGLDRIQSSLARVAKKKFAENEEQRASFVQSTLQNIRVMEQKELDASSTKDVDLVIEAVVENLEIKRQLFEFLDKLLPPQALMTTNTSSLSVAEICQELSPQRRERFGGLHFFNPVPVMKLLEVVTTDETSQQTAQALQAFGESVGKTIVKCRDTPGFVVNRLLVPLVFEAIRLVERGDASAEDVDTAMKLGAGHPMGPIELADYVGLDTNKFILEGWHKKFPENHLFRPSPTLDKLVEEGKLGVKSGQGFYKYDNKKN